MMSTKASLTKIQPHMIVWPLNPHENWGTSYQWFKGKQTIEYTYTFYTKNSLSHENTVLPFARSEHRCPFWLFWSKNRWVSLVNLFFFSHLPGPSGRDIDGPGLPGGLLIYQGNPTKPTFSPKRTPRVRLKRPQDDGHFSLHGRCVALCAPPPHLARAVAAYSEDTAKQGARRAAAAAVGAVGWPRKA